MRTRTFSVAAASAALAACICATARAQTPPPSPSPSPASTYAPVATSPAVPGAPVASAAHNSVPTLRSNTLIHPGDQLSVAVFGDSTLTQTTMVLSDGSVDYPLIGRVPVAGKSPDQAAAVLASHMREYVRHPVVSVQITQLGQPNVLVLGDVKTPGKYQLRSDARLTDAIAAAGGLANMNGAFPDARVEDANGAVSTVSLENLLQRGDSSLDSHLAEGSIVYVPGPVQMTIDVTGAVDHPGDIQISEGDHLSVAIAKAGDSQGSHADLNHIRVVSTDAAGKQSTQEYNLYDALKKGDQNADPTLKKGDVVYVPEAYQHRPSDFVSGFFYLLTRLVVP